MQPSGFDAMAGGQPENSNDGPEGLASFLDLVRLSGDSLANYRRQRSSVLARFGCSANTVLRWEMRGSVLYALAVDLTVETSSPGVRPFC